MNTLWKYKFWIGGAVCLVVIGLFIEAIRPKHVSGAQPGGSPDVEVVQVEQKDIPIYGEWIGTLDGFTNADVRAQVSGYLVRQGYQEGAFVKRGQLLFEIDPRPFQAALDQAKGQLAQATAQLANAEAVQRRTELDVNRYTPLAKEQAASQQDLDNAIQNNLAAKATVATAAAQIQTAEAAVETARINLDFTRLISPIDGIAGQAQQQVGALVSPSGGPVTTVSTVDPIKVYFTVSETEYLDFHRRYATQESVDAERKQLRLQLILADGSVYGPNGNFYFADRQVNQGTGAIRVAGLFPNPGNVLRPGQYGRVRTSTSHRAGRTADPTACGDGAAGRLPGCGGGKRRQNRCPDGQDRRSRRQSVDHRARFETRRARGCGGRAEGSSRHDGTSKAYAAQAEASGK
jgi:RND family efflux transporter MFP subunit